MAFKRISFNNKPHYGAGTGEASDQPFTRVNSWGPALSNNSETITYTIDSELPGNTTFAYRWNGNSEIYSSNVTGQFTTDVNGDFILSATIDRSWNWEDTTNVNVTVSILTVESDDVIETSPAAILRNAQSIEATGGNITTVSGGPESLTYGFRVHEFSGGNLAYNSSGFTITSLGLHTSNIDVRYLVVGAGGDGGAGQTYQTGSPGGYTYWKRECGGGGGGGQVQENTENATVFSETNYKMMTQGCTYVQFGTLSSANGGYGATIGVEAGGNVASGGGGTGQITYNFPSGVIGAPGGAGGNDGGDGSESTHTTTGSKASGGGGGGGAGGDGGNASAQPDGIFGGSTGGGSGGVGINSNIMGVNQVYGSGGGGGGTLSGGDSGGNAGEGGWFDASNPCVAYPAEDAPAGFGGGGGGAGVACGTGSNIAVSGGSGDNGTVRIRYPYYYKQLYLP